MIGMLEVSWLAVGAGAAVGVAVDLWNSPDRALVPVSDGSSGRRDGDRAGSDADADAVPSVTMLLEMMAAAIHQGASIPRAMEVVGESWGGELGTVLGDASRALHRGVGWRNAWIRACAHPRFGGSMTLLADALESSYRHGTSPLAGISAVVDQIDRDERRRIEEGAAKLGVRMLVPTGLCFLPSFIVLGIVPVIASFGTSVFG